MPLYDYACVDCGPFSALQPMARRDQPSACPHCSAPAPRVLLTAPRLELLTAGVRTAHGVNERSAHAPSTAAERRARHGSACGCCRSGPAASASPKAAKSFAGRRPWMISH